MAARATLNELSPKRLLSRLVGFLGPTGDATLQSLSALVFSSTTSFIAGATLAAALSEFARVPGVIMMTTAAIGLRGNIAGALGSRLSTAIHTEGLRMTLRPESVLGQNVLAAIALSGFMSLVLAVTTKAMATAFGVEDVAPFADLAMISILGGWAASLMVTTATVGVAAGAVRFGWDLDSLVAPTVSTLGDVVTIPCLWGAAVLLRHTDLGAAIGWLATAAAAATMAFAVRSRRKLITQILKESVPLLFAAMVLSTLAGLVITKRLEVFQQFGALMILQPAFVSSAGALGGILAARVATGLHLGTIEPEARPGIEARRDMLLIVLLSVPVFLFNGFGADIVARLTGDTSPGLGWMVAVSIVAAVLAIAASIGIAYYGTIAAFRSDIDPDSAGTPIVTSSVDFLGSMALVIVVATMGIV